MKALESISELKKGQKILYVFGNYETITYEYVSEHPNNHKYSVLIDCFTKEPKMVYNNYLLERGIIDFSEEDLDFIKFKHMLHKLEYIKPLIEKYPALKLNFIEYVNNLIEK